MLVWCRKDVCSTWGHTDNIYNVIYMHFLIVTMNYEEQVLTFLYFLYSKHVSVPMIYRLYLRKPRLAATQHFFWPPGCLTHQLCNKLLLFKHIPSSLLTLPHTARAEPSSWICPAHQNYNTQFKSHAAVGRAISELVQLVFISGDS